MNNQILLDILHSLRLKDWIKIIIALIIFATTNILISKWLLREREEIAHRNENFIKKPYLNIHPDQLNSKSQCELKNKRLEELSNKQKVNSKLARQQRREICEVNSRLREIKQEAYEKRINGRRQQKIS
ncbi:hypothetical protein FG379_002605 [Cryptosporidium bovis]|uniref:uncharacterized protein n=1 Tax=Cryptosporidium bovis TaxID=310047 RepID=UPI003519E1C3|nr:hypothetical protein FG379_002605 [Cryptosporidium bovis]